MTAGDSTTPEKRSAQFGVVPRICVMLFVALAAGAVNAQVYKWTDKNGKVVYGDLPPPEALSSNVKIPVTSFGGPPVFKSYSTAARRKSEPSTPPELVLYGADWCGYCRAAKAFFGSNGIAYREVNIDNNKAGMAEFKRVYGGGGIPLTVADDKTIRGFSAESMLYFLKGAGLVTKSAYIEKDGKR